MLNAVTFSAKCWLSWCLLFVCTWLGCTRGGSGLRFSHYRPAATLADSTPLPTASIVPASATAEVSPAEQLPPRQSFAADPTSAVSQFRIPPELPGASAAPLRLPPFDQGQSPQERRSLLEGLFPELPAVESFPQLPSSAGMDLSSLQQVAAQHSPVMRQAMAGVYKSRGLALQAGLYPNPTVGYQGDTIGTARTAGYNGIFASQEFVTAGKLTHAQNAALMDVRAAEHAARRTRIRLATDVRRNYFKVAIAQEQLQFHRAMAQLTNAAYRAQIDLLAGGESVAYEPVQLRVLAIHSGNNVIQAQNGLMAAWRQLAATLGTPDLEYTGVQGSPEISVPEIDFHAARDWMLNRHTDLAIAQTQISKACYLLRLQNATSVPNLHLYSAVQKDDTTTLNDVTFNVQVGVPLPVFDRNQGNIAAAHSELNRAQQDLANQRNQLVAQLSESYGRLVSYSEIVATYRSDILEDQVRVYRGVYERFRGAGDSLDFSQVVVTQQTLAQVIASYLQALTDQWTALVDVAELLQVDDLFSISEYCSPSPAAVEPPSGPVTELPAPLPPAAPSP